MTETSPTLVGRMIRDARKQRGLTQAQLAEALSTSQSAIARIETGGQNLSLETINKIAEALEAPLIEPAGTGTLNFRIQGPTTLSGSIEVRSSKNAAVALLNAALLNRGTTRLRGIARIEEVNRILEVLASIGVNATWSDDRSELVLTRPAELAIDRMDNDAARRTRSYFMSLPTLMNEFEEFKLPYAGGCDLGARTIEPHLQALRHYGLRLVAHDGFYACTMAKADPGVIAYTMTERGDMATENAILAAALHQGTTIIRNASPNYMVQDLCFFLADLGVDIEGIGTTTLTITGRESFDADITYAPSEDPIEAMSLITAAIVTDSELTITRCPIEFLEIELATLETMGLDYTRGPEYTSHNGRTRLVDLTVRPSRLTAPLDKIHPMPFPGLNIDNLPFFAVIAAVAQGPTLLHDWVYENRAIHLLDLGKLGASVQLLDPHRLNIVGPTSWRGRDIVCPPALRPAVCLLLAALAARGESVLRDVYVINRGYEDLPARLNALGASIEVFRD
ncbi:helix-turn-helix domain-containing protein [Aestuariimicrobium ganziense]|uniref:helix-turn-helix domain-containing protein n=1 Tax=Aestuariimicrobium ganziense TaxID=2773677 RepID=UPI001942EE4D|nr:helix-turn-helix domain-containing protein [Aestuariimicrobium ganziense]